MDVPAANGGICHVRIYTLAGELVNDLVNTCTAGVYNYIEWNGHNKAGQEVANGVYYGVVELSGKKPKPEDATFKMVVIK
jgi:flagellar hook assembly protein FlgD